MCISVRVPSAPQLMTMLLVVEIISGAEAI